MRISGFRHSPFHSFEFHLKKAIFEKNIHSILLFVILYLNFINYILYLLFYYFNLFNSDE